MGGFLYASLCRSAALYPDKPALVFNDAKSVTFRQFLDYTGSCASFLQAQGLQRGDMIYAALGSTLDFCALIYGAALLEITVIPVSTKLKQDGIEHLLSSIVPAAVFYDAERQPFFPELAAKYGCRTFAAGELNFKDYMPLKAAAGTTCLQEHGQGMRPEGAGQHCSEVPAVIMFTSGTTGTPKGAVISSANIEAAVRAYEQALALSAADRTVLGVPIFHITGLIAILALFVYLGGTIYVEARFKADRILKLIDEHQISFLHGSPTVFSLLKEEGDKEGTDPLLSLKSIACGAGRLNLGIIRALKQIFPNAAVHSVYGLTESTSPFTIYRGDLSETDTCESSGTVTPGCAIEIRSEEGQKLPQGQAGCIWIKGPMVIKRYYPEPEQAGRYFDGEFFNTGDIGLLTNSGELIVKDRVKDIINRGGEKIFCPEVESLISTCKGVLEVALVARPDPLYGEVPVAFIRLEPGAEFNPADLTAFLTRHLPRYQIPVDYQLVDDFPRTNNGKINKRALRTNLLAAAT